MPVIAVKDLTKVYKMGEHEVRALRGVSLDIEAGEFVAVTGPSGSGKSTFMHIAGCLDRPTSGEYDPRRQGRVEAVEGRAGARPQPEDRLRVPGLQPAHAHDGARQRRAAAALPRRRTGSRRPSGTSARWRRSTRSASAQRYHHMPNQLSGGQQQRVAIARALINEPSIILADEPTGNLDTRTSIEVMGIFQRLNKERGITVLLITHEMDIAEYGTRLIRFRDGRVVADQPVLHRRNAADELAALPPPEPDQIPPPAEPKPARRAHSDRRGPAMSMLMTLRIAFKALGRNKLRTALTMLGMIIGVAAVIAMVALGTGAQAHDRRADQGRRHQPHHDLRRAASTRGGVARGGGGTSTRLMPEDAEALRELPEIAVRRGERRHALAAHLRQPELEHAASKARTSTCR